MINAQLDAINLLLSQQEELDKELICVHESIQKKIHELRFFEKNKISSNVDMDILDLLSRSVSIIEQKKQIFFIIRDAQIRLLQDQEGNLDRMVLSLEDQTNANHRAYLGG